MKNLVVVESPTKAKTLARFLGKDFEIMASLGHVKDLPKSKLGVDVEHDFEPQYQVAAGKKKLLAVIKKSAAGAKTVYLSTDPDREGEAIAAHVGEELGKNNQSKIKRVVFHEITKEAVKEAFAQPRDVDSNLVDAQKARRVLDRLVGYKLSPLLWKKVRYGLSAGRVQSVAVRLIVERERERERFNPEEYWTIDAFLESRESVPLTATLAQKNDHKIAIKNEKEVKIILKDLDGADYSVKDLKTEEKKRYPSPPFTTSSLQQSSFNTLGFTARRTMRAAQALYEQGLITYHRTDSTNLAQSAVSAIRAHIKKNFGEAYLPSSAIFYKTKIKVAQEAHEAIRVTNADIREAGEGDMAKLYGLVWRRSLACQMQPAVFDQTTVSVSAKAYLFQAAGQLLKFDGWLKVFGVAEESNPLPPLAVGEALDLRKLIPEQHFTEPPARFTEATLIKELEKHGIGRPSTYAPIIATIKDRGYVSQDGRALKPEDVGAVVSDLLVEHFPAVVDLQFTAGMEEDLDKIARGEIKWVPVIKEFYEPFEKTITQKEGELKKSDITNMGETSEKCPECQKPLLIKLGRFGKFLSCSGYPDCKYAKPLEDKDGDGQIDNVDSLQLEGKCPEDGGELKLKVGRFGKFIACANYPKCKFTKPYLDKIGVSCPECKKGEVIIKKSRRGKTFFGCSNYPSCKYASWAKPPAPA